MSKKSVKDFTFHHTLGTGAYGKVVLAKESASGKEYAAKVRPSIGAARGAAAAAARGEGTSYLQRYARRRCALLLPRTGAVQGADCQGGQAQVCDDGAQPAGPLCARGHHQALLYLPGPGRPLPHPRARPARRALRRPARRKGRVPEEEEEEEGECVEYSRRHR